MILLNSFYQNVITFSNEYIAVVHTKNKKVYKIVRTGDVISVKYYYNFIYNFAPFNPLVALVCIIYWSFILSLLKANEHIPFPKSPIFLTSR